MGQAAHGTGRHRWSLVRSRWGFGGANRVIVLHCPAAAGNSWYLRRVDRPSHGARAIQHLFHGGGGGVCCRRILACPFPQDTPVCRRLLLRPPAIALDDESCALGGGRSPSYQHDDGLVGAPVLLKS